MKKQHIYLIISVLFFISCEKTVDNVEVPDVEPKLVAACFLEAGSDTATLKLTRSIPIFHASSGNYDDVKNAQVSISDGQNSVQLQYKNSYLYGDGIYFAHLGALQATEGQEFRLKITTPDGEEISSSCKVPSSPTTKIDLLDYDSIPNEWGYSTEYSFRFQLQDLGPDETSYYYFTVLGFWTDPFGNRYEDELYSENYGENYQKIKKGDKAIMKFQSYDSYDSLRILAYKTDEHYYHYHHSVSIYEGDNPFAEPVIIYSNIENGLGVFCAYQPKEYYLAVPK